VPSLRLKLRRAGRWVGLVTVGFLIYATGTGSRAPVLSPGPLTGAHSDLQCATCHTVYDRGLTGWIGTALTGDGSDDSSACIGCHEIGSNPLGPHSQDPQTLQALSERLEVRASYQTPRLLLTGGGSLFDTSDTGSKVACDACHREHRGHDAMLTSIDNHTCQSCHALYFSSFADGHPELVRYPSDRRTHIIFDHSRHITRHFAEARVAAGKPPAACGDCHEPDLFGRQMLVQRFDDTCADCHRGQIDGSDRLAGTTAIPVLAVPGIDLSVLEGRGFSVGEWPWYAEDELTPFMTLLLAGDRQTRRDLRVTASLDLLDLDDADHEQLAAVTRVAWSVKQLLFDVMVEGAPALRARLEATTGQRLDKAELADLIGALPRDVVGAAQEEWFPELLQEVTRLREGRLMVIPEAPSEAQTGPQVIPEEVADQPELQPGEDDDLLIDDDELLAGDDDDLLIDDDELLAGDDDLLAADPDDLLIDDAAGAPAEEPEPLVELPAVDPERWAALGGWYRQDLTLYYRPLGHADRFMQTWLDVLAATAGTRHEAIARPLLSALTDRLAPGACGKCHSIDHQVDGPMQINWQPTRISDAETRFTTFSHATHFSLFDRDGCISCHVVDHQADYLSAFKDQDPTSYAPGFKGIQKQLCAGCHVPDVAGDACTTCHSYHVGRHRHSILGTRYPHTR
jgi:hypothetical protein